jgi:sodium transport system permease protein
VQFSNIATIFKKEMTDTLRDRRTLIFMLLIPIVAIPLLIMGLSSLMVSQVTKVREEVSQIVIQGEDFLPEDLRSMFAEAPGLSVKDESEFEGKDIMDELKEGNLQALVVIPEGFDSDLEHENPAQIKIFYDEAEMKSEFAEGKVKDVLSEYKEQLVEKRMKQRDISTEILTPFTTKSQNVAPLKKMAGKEFGAFLPYLIIIMCFMGAMYPAIDLAAGEKERGTLETLLVSPATRSEFVVGKYLVILVTGIVAAFLSLGSLIFSLNYMVEDLLKGLTNMLAIELDVNTIVLMFLIILPLAGIFAGILLSVSIFARSFKEAQSYVTALNMAVILPAVISLLPGIEMSYKMAIIPIINASLIMKDAISGSIQWNYVLVALLSNAILAAVALLFSKKWFERESVLFRM